MDAKERDFLGRIVRNAWVAWAKTQPNPKPSWLVPWEELNEADKEADRQIAEAIAIQLRTEQLMFERDKLMKTVEKQAAEINRLRNEKS